MQLFRIRRLKDSKYYSTRTGRYWNPWNREGKFLTLRALSQVPDRIKDNRDAIIEVWRAHRIADTVGYANVLKRWRAR